MFRPAHFTLPVSRPRKKKVMLRQRRLIAALSSAVLAVCGVASVSAAAAASTARPAAASAHPAAPSAVLQGNVWDGSGTPLAGLPVSVCGSGQGKDQGTGTGTGQGSTQGSGCSTVITSSSGFYSTPVSPGTYSVTATDAPLLNGSNSPVTVPAGTVQTANLVLLAPTGLPSGVSFPGITPGNPTAMFYGSSHPFAISGQCTNAAASFTVTENGVVIASGPMPETPPGSGSYAGLIPSFAPDDHGYAQVTISLTCPGGPTNTIPFTIYLDPSGTVISPTGAPIGGATVTLLTAPTAAGPFTPVPNGSAVMSPANRVNPGVTAADGLYGWDVIPGFYEVQAQKAGCVAPTTPPSPVAVSAVLQIPPAVTGLLLTLDCSNSPATSIISANSATFTAGTGGSFTFAATGEPNPTWIESGALPAGVNFVAQAGGKAVLTVNPTAAPGTTVFTATAGNGVGSDVAQVFTLTVNSPKGPTFTSAASAGFTQGTGGSFAVTTAGNPPATVSESGQLPSGVGFKPNTTGGGTLVVSAGAAAGSTTITFLASSQGGGTVQQSFTFTITAAAPAITSWSAVQFTLTSATGGTFTVLTTGVPVAALSESGALPPGVTFTAYANGTATIAVAPSTPSGTYGFTINAVNGVSPAAAQPFTLTVS
jgi:hypothetical protein